MADHPHYGPDNAPLTFEEEQVSEVRDKIEAIQEEQESQIRGGVL